jgi:uncharacterized repeat protein (TIGR03803 family)
MLGTVFVLAPAAGQPWNETILHNFTGSDGQYPESTLVFGSSGEFYGTTLGGNGVAGTIFEMATPTVSGGAWTVTVLHAFPYIRSDPQNFAPNGTLLIGPGGTLYTTTQGQGLSGGVAIALFPPSTPGGVWTEDVVYSFPGTPGAGGPKAGFVSENGSLFGTTFGGGDPGCADVGCGTVYQLTPGPTHGSAWTESLIQTFGEIPGDGAGPLAALTLGHGGVLYGTTSYGGSGLACQAEYSGCGTAFQLTPPTSPGGAWTYSVIYNFTGINGDGANPAANLAVGNDGALYGTTEYGGSAASYSACPGSGFVYPGCGIVFQLTPPTAPNGAWTETILHSFSGANGDGTTPVAGLTRSPNGVLYGTTTAGGTAGRGTVFAVAP